MLAKNLNLSKGLVNGARGIVTQFDSGNAGYPVVKFMSGLEQVIGPEKWVVKAPGGGTITRRQLPLKLAWAVSIHKSQVKYVTVIKKFKLLSCKCISSNRQQQINISKKKNFFLQVMLAIISQTSNLSEQYGWKSLIKPQVSF